MKRLIFLLLVTIGIVVSLSRMSGQGTVVYKDWSPQAVRTVTIGTNHLTIWGKLGAPYDNEAACYENGVLSGQLAVATVGKRLTIDCMAATGDQITGLVYTLNGVVNFQLVGTPAGGQSIKFSGAF